ncbi:MAG TPA: AMP-binding protein [Geminicoccaceae bacterium]
MERDGRRHFDELEVRSPEQREADLLAGLPALIRQAKARAPAVARHLDAIEPGEITSRERLARLPVLRKSELADRQDETPPFGDLVATGTHDLARVFMSPGPIFEPEAARPDYWRMARALFAAGFRAGDLVHNTFAYHLTPAGAMIETGARALGCPVFPAGTGNSERQIEAIRHLRPVAYAGTPSFLKILLEQAAALGHRLDSLRKALVSGEAFPRSAADELRERHGIDARQCYATADLGLIAYETEAGEGLVLDEAVLVELVRPGTGDPVPDGEVGEVLVTSFNPDYPLIRFATGDLSAVLPGPSPCGRTNRRLKGWLGRADQATKVRGMFVHPRQVAATLARHPEVRKGRLVVDRDGERDRMVLHCEAEGAAAGLAAAVAESLRAVTGLKGEATIVAAGSLANDGKVIDDRRDPG